MMRSRSAGVTIAATTTAPTIAMAIAMSHLMRTRAASGSSAPMNQPSAICRERASTHMGAVTAIIAMYSARPRAPGSAADVSGSRMLTMARSFWLPWLPWNPKCLFGCPVKSELSEYHCAPTSATHARIVRTTAQSSRRSVRGFHAIACTAMKHIA